MAQATSPASGQRYGVRRVRQVRGVPRSSFHAARRPEPDSAVARPPAHRGPKPTASDEAPPVAIKDDLARSPRAGEGHRKVWARPRVRDGIRVPRKRVLRLMREHASPPPHRARQQRETAHDRRIITAAPNLVWAIDAARITAVQDGKIWLFGAAEHRNAELLGWHVAKSGNRFEATQALGMAVRRRFGRLSAGAARGVALRHGHGSNSMAGHFQKQVRFWGMSPSHAFVGEPETNGVIERLSRTLKEQVVHGRVFQAIDEVRDAVRAFVARYNAEWPIEKNGHRSPTDMRAARQEQAFRRAA
jgi:putative transposase